MRKFKLKEDSYYMDKEENFVQSGEDWLYDYKGGGIENKTMETLCEVWWNPLHQKWSNLK